VLKRIVAQKCNPAHTLVADVMTHRVLCARTDTCIEEAHAVMENRRISHLPMVDQGEKLLGMISIGDLNAYPLGGQEQRIGFLNRYRFDGASGMGGMGDSE